MSEVMMKLGDFTFSLDTAAYQELRRQTEYRWASQERVNAPIAQQAIGPGRDTVRLKGVVYPHFRGGLKQIEALRELAGKLEPLDLVDALGFYHGKWCVTRVEEGQTIFTPQGAPLKQEFTIELTAYGEEE